MTLVDLAENVLDEAYCANGLVGAMCIGLCTHYAVGLEGLVFAVFGVVVLFKSGTGCGMVLFAFLAPVSVLLMPMYIGQVFVLALCGPWQLLHLRTVWEHCFPVV